MSLLLRQSRSKLRTGGSGSVVNRHGVPGTNQAALGEPAKLSNTSLDPSKRADFRQYLTYRPQPGLVEELRTGLKLSWERGEWGCSCAAAEGSEIRSPT